MTDSRIVVTGIGASSPVGGTAPDSWSALLSGDSGTRALDYAWVEKYDLPVTFAAQAKVRPDTVLERP
jgi:3-oxoacyl-[acyl-carrier-protein] synthase II